MVERRCTRRAHGGEQRRHVREQRVGVLARRHARPGEHGRIRGARDEQHALGAGELDGLVEQELTDARDAADPVEAHAGLDEPRERLAQARLHAQVLGQAGGGLPLRHHRLHDGAVIRHLGEEVAPQALVGDVADRLDDVAVGAGERAPCGGVAARGHERLAMHPPCPDRRHALDVVPAAVEHRNRRGRGGQRTRSVPRREPRLRERGERDELQRHVVRAFDQRVGVADAAQRFVLAPRPVRLQAGDQVLLRREDVHGEPAPRVERAAQAFLRRGQVAQVAAGVRQHPVGRGDRVPHDTRPPIGVERLLQQPPRVPVEPERAVHERKVVPDHRLPVDVAGRLEGGERLREQRLAPREIGLVEREQVERVAGAEDVAGGAGQAQRLFRRAIRFGAAGLRAARARHAPQRTALPERLLGGGEEARRLLRVARAGFVVAQPELGLREPQQRHRLARLVAGPARGRERIPGDRERVARAAGADVDVGAARQCLREMRGIARAPCEGEHRVGIGERLRVVAERDAAFGAELQQVELQRDREPLAGERRVDHRDRLYVAAGAGERLGIHQRSGRRRGGAAPARRLLHVLLRVLAWHA